MDQELKGLMKQLGDAINSSLSDSEEIAEVISRIHAGGYDVFVVLEATIGFNERNQQAAEKTVRTTRISSGELTMSSQDLKFLKSLRISVDGGE